VGTDSNSDSAPAAPFNGAASARERWSTAKRFQMEKNEADLYIPFILATLEKYPKLTAARLFGMVKERGYDGAPSRFRAVVC